MVKRKISDGVENGQHNGDENQDVDPTNPRDPRFDPKLVKESVHIKPLRERTVVIGIRGRKYLQLRFSKKALLAMQELQTSEKKSKATKKADRKPRNYEEDYVDSQYVPSTGGGVPSVVGASGGIPAAAFRNAAISACRVSGFAMTLAKLSIFIEEDDFDAIDHTPLVKITSGAPVMHIGPARNANFSTDIRVRALWPEWTASVTVRFDEDQFNLQDIANLFNRVGHQVGVGEGRPDSRKSAGMGMGMFEIVSIKAYERPPSVDLGHLIEKA